MTDVTRRRFLRVAGASAATAAVGTGTASASSGSDGSRGEWVRVDSPTDRSLAAVAHAGGRAYAVGSNGVVLERSDGTWTTRTANGPAGNGANLHAVAAEDDGGRVWVAGASGALAAFDTGSAGVTSFGAPDDVTNEFTDVAVTGSGANAVVRVTDASGHVHTSKGADGHGRRTWTHETPGSGASVRAIATRDATAGSVVTANGAVYATTDGGSTWEQTGIADADGGLYDVAIQDGQTRVAGSKLYLQTGDSWDATNPVSETLRDVEVGPCGCAHAVGDGGTVLHRPGKNVPMGTTLAQFLGLWNESHPVDVALHGVAMGHPHVAVGANGTIIEK